jgi:hypothetical protein
MRIYSTSVLFAALLFLIACKDKETPSPQGGKPSEQDVRAYHRQGVGASAQDLLADTKYTSLQVELVYVEGFAPAQATLDKLTAFLQARLHKPAGISIHKRAIVSPGLAPYSIEDLQTVEEDHRQDWIAGDSLAVFVFITDGAYAGSENVLGVAHKNTSLALFGSQIQQHSGGLGQPSQSLLESTVLQHEFGHIMGLVNVGSALQSNHQDAEHGKHCVVENCLMYWTAETGDVVANLVGVNKGPSLDSQCIADLQANGGK